MKKLLVLASLGALLLIPSVASANWIKLGERAIDFRSEKDTIYCSHGGAMKGIMFKITRNTVKVHSLTVVYGNGEVNKVRVGRVFAPGESSGYLDLPGRRRVVRRVEFFYKTVGPYARGKAHVQLFGRQ